MFLSYKKAYALLKKYKIPLVKSYFFLQLNELSKPIKFDRPYVLKVDSPDILHKTDAGCVITNIKTNSELKSSLKGIMVNAFNYNPNARIESFVLQEQVSGLELIVGSKLDKTFGKIILFGLGGIFTEVYNDVAIRALPLTEKDIDSMIKEIRAYKILKGYRGKTYNLNALKNLISSVAELLENEPIEEMDLNPVILNEKSALVADWRIKLGGSDG